MQLLFSSGLEDLSTEDSIKIYNSVTDKFVRELKRRDKKADTEKEVISVFINESPSLEGGRLVPITFSRTLEQQIL